MLGGQHEIIRGHILLSEIKNSYTHTHRNPKMTKRKADFEVNEDQVNNNNFLKFFNALECL